MALCAILALFASSPARSSEVLAQDLEPLLKQRAEQAVAALPAADGATRTAVRIEALDSRLRFPACARDLDIDVEGLEGAGRAVAKARCREPAWHVYVPIQVEIYRPAVVAATAIARGRILAEEDLSLAETDVLGSGGRHFERLEDAVGQEARRTIAAGSVVSSGMLQAPKLIRRGDTVRVTAHGGGLSVSSSGTALSDGRRGEQIRIRNSSSERVIRARVRGPGEAEVIF